MAKNCSLLRGVFSWMVRRISPKCVRDALFGSFSRIEADFLKYAPQQFHRIVYPLFGSPKVVDEDFHVDAIEKKTAEGISVRANGRLHRRNPAVGQIKNLSLEAHALSRFTLSAREIKPTARFSNRSQRRRQPDDLVPANERLGALHDPAYWRA